MKKNLTLADWIQTATSIMQKNVLGIYWYKDRITALKRLGQILTFILYT